MNRCCARCKTPFNCGNRDCRCHPVSEGRKAAALHALQDQQARLRAAATMAGHNPSSTRGK